MKLCLGTFFSLIKLCIRKKPYVPDYEIYNAFVVPIHDEDIQGAPYGKTNTSKVHQCFHCQHQMNPLKKHIQAQKNRGTLPNVVQTIWKNISEYLDVELSDLFILALKKLVDSDPNITPNTLLGLWENDISFGQLDTNDYGTYVVSVFLYAALYTNNYEGEKFVDEITEEYLRDVKPIEQNPNPLSKHRLMCIAKPPISTYLPYGRENAYALLHEKLQSRGPVFVTGIGGIGKSEFVLHSMEQLAEHEGYQTFQTEFKGSLLDTILTLEFSELEIGKKAEDYTDEGERDAAYKLRMNLLRAYDKKTILLVDNFDAPDLRTYDLLLQDGRESPVYSDIRSLQMHFVFTTRNTDFYDEESVHVGPLPKDTLRKMIFRYREDRVSAEELQTVDSLLEKIEHHTFAADLIGRILYANVQLTINDVMQAFCNGQLDDAEWDKIRSNYRADRQERGILEHLMLLFSMAGLSEIHKRLLCSLSILPYGGAPIEWGRQLLARKEEADRIGIKDSSDFQEKIGCTSPKQLAAWEDVKTAIADLCKGGWLQQRGSTIDMHRLMRIVCWNDEETSIQWNRVINLANSLVFNADRLLRHRLSVEDYPAFRTNICMMESINRRIYPQDFSRWDNVLANMTRACAEMEQMEGSYFESGLLWLKFAAYCMLLEHMGQATHDTFLQIAQAFSHLAQIEMVCGNSQKTLEYLNTSIKYYRIVDEDNLELAYVYQKRALYFDGFNVDEKAEEDYLAAHRIYRLHNISETEPGIIRKQYVKFDDGRVAWLYVINEEQSQTEWQKLHKIGVSLIEQNLHQQGISYLIEAIQYLRQMYGTDTVYSYAIHKDLADAYASIEQYECAQDEYQTSIVLRERYHINENMNVKNGLAFCLWKQGKTQEAIQCAMEAFSEVESAHCEDFSFLRSESIFENFIDILPIVYCDNPNVVSAYCRFMQCHLIEDDMTLQDRCVIQEAFVQLREKVLGCGAAAIVEDYQKLSKLLEQAEAVYSHLAETCDHNSLEGLLKEKEYRQTALDCVERAIGYTKLYHEANHKRKI